MPLKDHFHPPLSRHKDWTSVHGGWAFTIAQRLNDSILSPDYESSQHVHVGSQVEIDIATFEKPAQTPPFDSNGHQGGTATEAGVYAPPVPSSTGEVTFAEPDLIEILTYRHEGGLNLVAAIELVSPANKDRKESRRSFAIKVASYLQKGVSVVVVDVVTERHANLHEELRTLLELPGTFEWQSPTGLSAVSYRMVQVKDRTRLDVWSFPLAMGESLPTMPLWLAFDLAVPLELERTYTTVCRSLRIE